MKEARAARTEAARTRGHPANTNTLGGRLRARRKALGWTQMHLASLVGTSQAVIQKIENGKSLRPRILEEIAEVLQVRPSWLMFGVHEVDDLNPEAIEIARAWAKLEESRRAALRQEILKESGASNANYA